MSMKVYMCCLQEFVLHCHLYTYLFFISLILSPTSLTILFYYHILLSISSQLSLGSFWLQPYYFWCSLKAYIYDLPFQYLLSFTFNWYYSKLHFQDWQVLFPHKNVLFSLQKGYTFMAEARTGDQSLAAGRWRLRLISSHSPLPFLSREAVNNIYSTKEIKDYYVPNDKCVMFR